MRRRLIENLLRGRWRMRYVFSECSVPPEAPRWDFAWEFTVYTVRKCAESGRVYEGTLTETAPGEEYDPVKFEFHTRKMEIVFDYSVYEEDGFLTMVYEEVFDVVKLSDSPLTCQLIYKNRSDSDPIRGIIIELIE
ncbi:MAG: hypothetical protein LIO79_03880 [Rikenellaceae bacterium]|nr:hypothetical protein [Rikenellaceae bacterium]